MVWSMLPDLMVDGEAEAILRDDIADFDFRITASPVCYGARSR
jgi:hypothetical protein